MDRNGLDRETLRRLSRRSDLRGSLQLASHAAVLVGTGLLVRAAGAWYWLLPAMLLHGVVLQSAFCALHETVHRTAFASRRANEVVGWVCGALLLLPANYFRLFHLAHHRFTQDPARDPELQQAHPDTLRDYLWRASGLPNWSRRVSITLRHALTGCVAEPFVPVGRQRVIVREARILWFLYLAVALLSLLLHSRAALVYWILPVALGQPFLRLYLLSEHIGCAQAGDIYSRTRTTYSNAAVRWLAWQMPFHAEHHAYPAVPFHALAKVNAQVRSRLAVEARGYAVLHAGIVRGYRARRRRDEMKLGI